MKGYIKRIFIVILIIIVFVVSFNVKIDNSLGKTIRTIANSNKSADTCTTGDGKVYYVKNSVTSSLTIRDTNSTSGKAIGSLTKCTEVVVYCTSGGWGKISKVSDKWVSMDYLSESRPTSCTNIPTTATDPISFGNITRIYIPYGTSGTEGTEAEKAKQMYRNKPGTIEMILNSVKNMASDEQNKINVKITKSNVDVTSNFDIVRSGIDTEKKQIIFNLKMKANTVYDEGQYTVTFSYAGATKSQTFDLVGKYYNFTISVEKTKGSNKNYINKENEWQIYLNNVEPTDAISSTTNTKNNFKLSILDASGKDASSHFTITYNKGYIEVANKTTSKKPDPGNYRMVVKYQNTSYTTARSDYEDSYEFTMGSRLIEFNEKSDLRTSFRYNRYNEREAYQIKIVRKNGNNIIIKEKNSNGTYSNEITLSQDTFTNTYTDFSNSDIVYGSDGRPIIKFGAIDITRFVNDKYTYTENGTAKTSTLQELETAYPGITSFINSTDTNGLPKYTFDSNGYIEYNAQGYKTVQRKSLQTKNKAVLSSSGGIMNFVIEHSGLSTEDESVMPVITRADGVVMTEADGFRIVSQRYENIGAEDGGMMYLTIEYDNTDYTKYTNTYTVSYTLSNIPEKQTFSFTLNDGDVDYYLMSTYDAHLTDPFEAINTEPPGNKRYEYYLGFYLMKTGGVLMNYKPSNEMTYKVFTEQVDCDDNSTVATCENSMYYFKQIDYTLSIVKYINNEITFDVTTDVQANNKRYTLTVEQFKEKYYEVWDLIGNYTFDDSGNLNGNKYNVQVKKIYNGNDNEVYVDYVVDGKTEVITSLMTDFSALYPEYYVYVTNHFTTDANDNVVNGRLRGSYRIREENGVPIKGEEITDQFNFTIDANPNNVDRAITVFPATEVKAGTYYVYVGFEGRMGVGYTNNSDDPVITREQFPEMWNRSIHMTTIVYGDPVYDIEFTSHKYSNNQNNSNVLYANIPSKGEFGITTKYIYDYTAFSYRVERKKGNSWVNADDSFIAASNFSSEGSNVTINTIPGITEGGDYRIVIEYNRDGFTLKEPKIYEFSVNNKYYGIAFNNNPNVDLTFTKNYTQTKEFDAIGYYVTNVDNVQFKLVRCIDNETSRELTWDEAKKRFLYEGKEVFKYEVKTSQIDTDSIDYTVELTNIKDMVEEGEYELTLSYTEDSGEVVSSSIKFYVKAAQYQFTIGEEEKSKVNSEGYSIQREVYASFINYENLDFIEYVVYYHTGGGNYIDVSSEDSIRRMFIVTDNFSSNKYNNKYNGIEYEYKGLLNIAVDPEVVDFNGDYYISMKYDNSKKDVAFTSPGKLFNWSSSIKVNANFNNNGVKVPVENFFLNVDEVTINVDIKTPHEDMAKYIITSSCLNGTCTPTQEINLNNRFDLIKSESNANKLVLKYKNNLTDEQKLKRGTYALVVYYNDNDMDINTFDVVTEYTEIKIDDVIKYSDISYNRTEPNLFKNKVGHIEIPVKVIGVDYDKTMVSITKNGVGDYSNAFTYNRSKYESDHVLEFTYNPNSGIEAGDYSIMISYKNADGVTISDNVIITINKSYFNFEIGDPIYNPNPPIANADPYGEVIFDIATEEIENVSISSDGNDVNTEKHKFAANTVITNTSNVDVTSMFDISAEISTTSPANFNLVLKYTKNSVLPGLYSIKISYTYNGYLITKNTYFEIADYEKDITIKNMEIISNTNDNRIHNNIGGIFKINYESIYDISVDDIAINVTNKNNTLVTDNFKIVKASNYISVELISKNPALNSGDYTINIIYTDSKTGKVKNHSLPITIYGYYKQISISNMLGSTSKIYADLPDQYYTFALDTSNINDQELKNIQARIYDKYGHMVMSSIASDNVNNIFDVVNEVKTNGYFKINILAFKAPIGEYEIELLLANDNNDYNISNRLSFNINATAYRVRLSSDSTITPSNIYNNDNNSFYDTDAAKVNYLFTSNYHADDASYSLKVFNNGALVQEITNLDLGEFNEFGIEYLTAKVDINNLDVGSYEIAICLKGLPYESKTIQVYPYIPVSNVTLTTQGEIIEDSISTNIDRLETIVYYIEPSNATNKVLEFASSDEKIFTISNNTITPVAAGSAKLIVQHRDYNKEITINISNRIASEVYEIDYEAKTIFVNTLKSTKFTRNDLISNLTGLSNDYQVRDSNDNIVNDGNGLVGTKSKVISGGDTYTIILIGDVFCDGIINLTDVTYLFRIYRGYFQADEYVELAAKVNKGSNIAMYDVTKLFRFYRGIINEI